MTDEQIERVAKAIALADPALSGRESEWGMMNESARLMFRDMARAALAAMPDAAAIRDAALREALAVVRGKADAARAAQNGPVSARWATICCHLDVAADEVEALIDSPAPVQPSVQEAAETITIHKRCTQTPPPKVALSWSQGE